MGINEFLTQYYCDIPAYDRGYLTATAVILLVFVFIILLKIIFLLSRGGSCCKQLTINSESGAIVLSSHVIADAICTMKLKNIAMSITRCNILQWRKELKLVLTVYAELDARQNKSLVELTEELRQEVKVILEHTLGIDFINQIEIRLKRINIETSNETNTEKVASAFITTYP
ncbi:MAG: hypothetical protein RR060_04270, partial [Victivallaceae bacterium]